MPITAANSARIIVTLVASTACCLAPLAANAAPSPKLQFINASQEPAEVFWVSDEGDRTSMGVVAPGEDNIITTTIGHRFTMVGLTSGSEVAVASLVPVQGVRFEPGTVDGVPKFYSQRVDAGGFPIVASASVNPYALEEAKYLFNKMLAKRPDVRDAMVKSGARLCIFARDEFTTDLPEFAHMGEGDESPMPGLNAKDYWDARARGTGGSETDPFCSCGEENLLGYEGDPYFEENILIHEIAHNIHLRGMTNVDPTFDDRLEATYQRAMAAGLWKNKYAANNRFEYFAEGTQSWFGDNRENDHDHNHVNTRAELIEYDPALAGVCREVFGDTELVYTKPATRLTGHLEGYDPEAAPKFVWPRRLDTARKAIKQAAIEADLPKDEEGPKNEEGPKDEEG